MDDDPPPLHPPYADSHLFPLSESCATVNPCDWPERSALSQSCALFLILMPCDCEISALIYIPCALVLEKLYPALQSCYAFYAGRTIIAFFSWQKCIHKYKDKAHAQTEIIDPSSFPDPAGRFTDSKKVI